MKTEVLIVGGGLAGIVCTIELPNKKTRVILVDRAEKERSGTGGDMMK
jgi:succinate dehydrogenase/fumarate reductase flavoprotein subunit